MPNLTALTKSTVLKAAAGSGGSGAVTIAAWAASTAYTAGQLVTYQGNIYSANSSFTSGASFNPANWTALVGSRVLQVAQLSSGSSNTVMNGTGSGMVQFTGYPVLTTPSVSLPSGCGAEVEAYGYGFTLGTAQIPGSLLLFSISGVTDGKTYALVPFTVPPESTLANVALSSNGTTVTGNTTGIAATTSTGTTFTMPQIKGYVPAGTAAQAYQLLVTSFVATGANATVTFLTGPTASPAGFPLTLIAKAA